MIPLLTYRVDSVYDELMRYGWALMDAQRAGTEAGMGLEYLFSGGGFDISLVQADTGKYFIRIYNYPETIHCRRIIAVSDTVPSHPWATILRISTGDMIRLLYGDPLTFGLRLEQYKVVTALDEL